MKNAVITIYVNKNIKSHPYLELLYGELMSRHSTLTVSHMELGLDGMIKILKTKGKIILHLHWIETFRKQNRLNFIIIIFYLSCILIFLRFIRRVKIITTLHNIVPHEIKYITLEHLLFKLILTLSNSIIVHSKIAKLISTKLYDVAIKKINVIPHGNFIKQYPNKTSMVQARERLGIPQNRFVILFFGYIRRYKGLEIILDFLKKFDKLPEIIKKEILFLFAGCFREKEFLHSLLKLRDLKGLPIVIYDKFVDNNYVQYFMNSCNIGLIPYESITTPGSLLLFMSFKKPVIISRHLNILELANEKFCIFLREYSGDELSLAIQKAYFWWKLGRLEEMGNHSYNEALKYDWKIISEEHFKLFTEKS